MRRVSVFLLLVAVALPALAEGAVRLDLAERVVVHGDRLTLADLAAAPVEADWGRTVLCAAPAPGHSRTFDRADLWREMLRAGVRPMPELAGAQQVEVVRPGQSLAPDRLAEAARSLLGQVDLPTGALDQRLEIDRAPALRVGGGRWHLELDGDVPRIGRGSVPVEVVTEHGDRRRVYVTVRRQLRLPVLRTTRGAEGGREIDFAVARIDTVWTDDRAVLDQRIPTGENDGRWTLRRRCRGGEVLLARDVRATPVVRRGERVEWIVERAGLLVSVTARSRGDGAVGEWVLVESPFDHRLRRVCVTGPGRVADHPPRDTERASANPSPSGGRP